MNATTYFSKKVIFKIFFFFFFFYSIATTTIFLIDIHKKSQTVLVVNGKKISRIAMEKEIIRENWDNSFEPVIDRELIFSEAEKRGIRINRSDLVKEAELVNNQLTNGIKLNVNNPVDSDYLKERIFTKKLAEQYLLKDDKIKQYEIQHPLLFQKISTNADVYMGNHDILSNMENDMKNGMKLSNVEQKYKIKPMKVTISENNDYGINIKSIKQGDIIHDHMSKDPKLFYIEKINIDNLENSNNLKTKKNIILKNGYDMVRMDLINYFREKLPIQITSNIKY